MKAKKIVVIALALVLMCGTCIGGTYAWLMAKSDTIQNSFTVGKVAITLEETTGNEYKMIPGATVAKDPKVTVKSGSEECYVFVKVDATNVANVLVYEIADGWTMLTETATSVVYYREQAATDADVAYDVLKNNQITVAEDVNVNTAAATLNFTAYAIQKTGMTDAADAWATVSTAAADQFATPAQNG
ncbi:MAG: hypothetical protein E7620_06750 [Ruminococcaceae bacterium]|nr:hypothetical protein [Oscillospiraceae bacterium]